MTTLNKNLIKKQNLTPWHINKLQDVYDELFELIKQSEHESILTNKELIDTIEGLEYTLQRLWKFTPDRNYHTYWYRTNRCSCPIMDNDDLMGSKYRIYSFDCKLHSQ